MAGTREQPSVLIDLTALKALDGGALAALARQPEQWEEGS
jgi:hypothetical protein